MTEKSRRLTRTTTRVRLEFPAAIVFVGNVGYVPNYDRPRGDNLAEDGTSGVGIGSSIARFNF